MESTLAFALSVVRDRGQARVAAAVAARSAPTRSRLLLRTPCWRRCCRWTRRHEDGRVALAFRSWTALHPAVTPGLRSDTAQLVEFIAGLLPSAPASAAAAGLLGEPGIPLHPARRGGPPPVRTVHHAAGTDPCNPL